MNRFRFLHRLLVCALATGVAAAAAHAQVAGPIWVSLDTLPAGTPPSVVVDRGNSTEDQSVFNVTFHGFYYEPVSLPGVGNFRKIHLVLNGIQGNTMTAGRPELPIHPLTLGIPTNAPALGTPQITVVNSTVLTGYDIFPAQSDFLEQEGVPPTPPPPAYDAAFYAQNTTFPPTSSAVVGVPELMHGVKTQGANIHPFRCNPGLRTLTIQRQISVLVPHNGTALPQVEVTRRTSRMLAQALDNWTAILGQYVIPNTTAYKGEYLIITPEAWRTLVLPFAQQKSERGYRVTIRTIENIGSGDSSDIYSAIDTWYGNRPTGADCYALLIGDTDKIQMGYSPRHASYVSDYAYACHPLGSNSQQDLYLGRISVSSTTELTRILSRIMTYQDNPASSSRYDNVLLAAHNQLSNGYVQCINEIFSAFYAGSSPQFVRRRGSVSDGTVANVFNDMAAGQGVVLYRGHGGGTSWAGWDFNDQSLTSADVNAMSINFVRPVVFSVACTNSQLDRAGEPCISEAWHRRLNGAVAHVGGSRSTWTYANHTFAKSIAFWTYFLSSAPTISVVTDISGFITALNHGDCGWDNRYLYLLQGDPEMVIWRANPVPTQWSPGLRGSIPQFLSPGLHVINLTLTTTAGDPVVGALVAAYKENDIEANRYTDANGDVSLLFAADTCGELTIRAYTDDASVIGQRLVVPIVILGDANFDGIVSFPDVITTLANWGNNYSPGIGLGDSNLNGLVSFPDVVSTLANWADSCQ